MCSSRHNDIDYCVNVDTELYDLLREVDGKYEMQMMSLDGFETKFSDYPNFPWIFVESNTLLNDVYREFGIDKKVEDTMTFNDLLNENVKLNEIIETEDMDILVTHLNATSSTTPLFNKPHHVLKHSRKRSILIKSLFV